MKFHNGALFIVIGYPIASSGKSGSSNWGFIADKLLRAANSRIIARLLFPNKQQRRWHLEKAIIFRSSESNRRNHKSSIFLEFFREFLFNEMKYQTFFRSTLLWRYMWIYISTSDQSKFEKEEEEENIVKIVKIIF